jgi:hypothetical protein
VPEDRLSRWCCLVARQRAIELLRCEGVTVVETTLRHADSAAADEIFRPEISPKVAPAIPDRRPTAHARAFLCARGRCVGISRMR